MNLQLFAEGDPAPTPEPTPADIPPSDPINSPQDPANDPPPPQGAPFKLKHNHEEKEVPYEEGIILAQKGMNYDKGIERARQEGIDAAYASLGYEWQGKPITTESEYKAAVKESELLEQYKELPPEVAQKLTAVDQLEQRLSSYERKDLLNQQEKSLADKPFFAEWKPEIQSMAEKYGCNYDVAYALIAEQKMPEILSNYETKLKTSKEDAVKEYLAQKTKPQGTVEGQGATPVIDQQKPKSFADARKNSLELLKMQFQKE